MNVPFNVVKSRFILVDERMTTMGSYACSPNESQLRALRGVVIGIVDAFVTAGIHDHPQHSEVPYVWI